MTIKVLLADDHRIFCDCLRLMIDGEPGMEVVGIATDGRQAVTEALRLMPDVVVMDVAMPELNGMGATRQILDAAPSIKILALSMHTDRRFIEGMLEAGAVGYLLKEGTSDELARAIETVMQGQVYLCPAAATIVVRRLAPTPRGGMAPPTSLSPREQEVLQLLAEGNSAKSIAEQLFISSKTVETHRRNIMDKIGVTNLADLTKFAIREGFTTLDT